MGQILMQTVGDDRMRESFESIATAIAYAKHEIEIEVGGGDSTISVNGLNIINFETGVVKFEGNDLVVTMKVKAAPGMILFVGQIMAALPDYATVQWRDGFPFINCPPRDDRDVEAPVEPLVPNNLEPA